MTGESAHWHALDHPKRPFNAPHSFVCTECGYLWWTVGR
jgi:hypothetical protein